MDLSDARTALRYISPSDDRKSWWSILAALKTEFGDDARDIAESWSAESDQFNAANFRSTWRSTKPGKISIGTLIYRALDGGWKPTGNGSVSPQEQARRDRAREQARQRVIDAEREQEQAEAVARAKMQRWWGTAKDADPLHPYGVAKNLCTWGLRQQDDILLVPLHRRGELITVQRIWPDGTKKMYPGIRSAGAYYKIGALHYSPVFICEGWATGRSIYDDTFHPVICAMSAGQLLPIGKAYRKAYPDCELIIAGDNDTDKPNSNGTRLAIEAAEALGCEVAIPEHPGDFNDERNRMR